MDINTEQILKKPKWYKITFKSERLFNSLNEVAEYIEHIEKEHGLITTKIDKKPEY